MPDANTVAIGAPNNSSESGISTGHVRVYSLVTVSITDNIIAENHITVYPNPTTGKCTIEFDNYQELLTVCLHSMTGQELMTKQFRNTNQIQIEIDQPNGIYILEIIDGQGKKATLKLIKE
jgi:hypothetical protein